MSNFESAFKTVSELVDDFKANDKIFLSPNYSEADVRNDFLNKFFSALGWDVRHDHQKNPYEQEVRVEKPVQVAKAQKRADYTFYLIPNFRDVKFFVEAKKPYHDLVNKDYFFQTVRYGWNANTPIAVLTDFEEFIILDCRYRPDINDILNYKIKSYHHLDYANEEIFKQLYFLFSREAVADNSLEKYSAALPKPKGKAIQRGLHKGGFQSIDESFLEELDEIRIALAKSFKKNNSHLTSEELTEATQRTIDRLVFIKFLEDKMIEPHHYVSEFGNRRTAWEDFITVSLTLDAKYNGVVFKKTKIDSKNIIEPDDKTFSNICQELSHENTPYNFDAIPIHILGSIYERFLGKVVNATDKRVTIEEKPEVRKAGGVYYTPQYIVNYIVDNTIGKLIAGDSPFGKGKTPKEISKLRFADIACGSGSFLITVYERLLDYHKRWYLENPEQAKKDGCILFEGAYRLSLQQKQRILTNNIYGVDLDSQAVEVTQLSLYLKLLEDETTATANDTWVMFKEQLLPNLNNNIICGNSLIGTDIQTSLLFTKGGIEGGLDELKLKPMDFEKVFPDIMRTGGFDAIVGNPPYVAIDAIDVLQRDYFSKEYANLIKRYDLFGLFIEKGRRLLCDRGKLAYIIPMQFLRNSAFVNLRYKILTENTLEEINHVGDKVFKNANNDTIILIIAKDKSKVKNTKIFLSTTDANSILTKVHFLISQDVFKMSNEYSFELSTTEKRNIFEKIEHQKFRIKDHFQVIQGIVSGLNEAYVLGLENKGEVEAELLRPYVFGSDFEKFTLREFNTSILYINKETEINRYPRAVQRLARYKTILQKRREVKKKMIPWYSLQWPRRKEYFESPKIFFQKIRNQKLKQRLVGTYDEDGLYLSDGTIMVRSNNDDKNSLKYLLAILNSSLYNFYFREKFLDINLKIKYLEETYIIINDSSILYDNIYNLIPNYVDQMLTSKKQLQQAKTESDKNYLERKCESLDKQIDELVYKLYGLSEEEIKIVEQK